MEIIRQAIRNGRVDDSLANELATRKFECELWDYKEKIDLTSSEAKAEIARDCAAFHNKEGGYILIGVKDKTWDITGVDETILTSITQTHINDIIRSYIGERFGIIYRVCRIPLCRKPLGLIYVPPRTGRPVIMKKNGPQIGRDIMFRQGDIFIRSADSTCRATTDSHIEAIWGETAVSLPKVEPSNWNVVEYGFRLPPKPEPLIGRDRDRETVFQSLDSRNRWWISSIEGLGGVGKTALASEIVWELYREKRFETIISVSAKNRELSENRILPLKPELIGIDSVVDAILEATGFKEDLCSPIQVRIEMAKQLLESTESLLFLDNLETVDDPRVFDFLKNLPQPTRALVTSRRQPETGEDRIRLTGLAQTDSVKLVHRLLETWNLLQLADEESINSIVRTSGGLPLAILWLVGQVRLQQSTSFISQLNKEVPIVPEQILEFSFRNMFNLLSEDQKLILKLSALSPQEPLSIEHYMHLAEWDRDRTNKALNGLIQSSLFLTNATSSGITYSVLPITASFAFSELVKNRDYESAVRARYREMQFRQQDAKAIVDYLQSLFHGKDEAEQLAVGLAKAAAEEYSAGNYDKGRSLFDQAESYYDKSPYVFYTRATSELNAGNSAQAYVYFERATKLILKPTAKDAVVWKMWGQALKQEGDWQRAIEKLSIALSLNENDPYILHMMAFCQSKIGQYSGADRTYSKALQIIGDSNPRQRKLTLTAMAQNIYQWGENLERAINLINEAERLPGSNKRTIKLYDSIEKLIAEKKTMAKRVK
ncbi:hypothetical protein GTO91_03805 [Heliobacterium undosum]|uniref:Schlafen AlbA-2 domain-containing protein n=1 Tax=Heliomicrobium undosum TaxID=121734 RepID=A0A845KYX8_9FIRM|nr:RNA-binding domain-containing protein [Heliomicrobium undosum]MZP28833.1 hypothetical protein [Heliomicrobium undosum]